MNYTKAKNKMKCLHKFSIMFRGLLNYDHLITMNLLQMKILLQEKPFCPISPLTNSLHWMCNNLQTMLKEKAWRTSTHTPERWLCLYLHALMENLFHVPESYFSKHLLCTNWSFNWFCQHSRPHTQHILIATSSRSNAQLSDRWEEDETNQPLLNQLLARGEGSFEKPWKSWYKWKVLYSPIAARITTEFHGSNHFTMCVSIKSSYRTPDIYAIFKGPWSCCFKNVVREDVQGSVPHWQQMMQG